MMQKPKIDGLSPFNIIFILLEEMGMNIVPSDGI